MQKKILVVDDDHEAVELLRFNLKKAGFAVGTAGDGLSALRKACSLSPDLILLDLMMPELDGLAVCEILKRDPVTAPIPIIMITAISTHLGRINGLAAGACDYITKPFSPEHVIELVRNLLRTPSESASASASSSASASL